jgi:C-terminal processing protease CtpA/Prc
MTFDLRKLLAWSAGGALALALAATAGAQVTVPKVAPKTPSTIPAEGAVDTVREQAREAREAAREAGDEARDTAKGARREAREATRDAREATRDARQEVRESGRNVRDAAQEIQSLRAADIGLWFTGRGATDGLLVADIAADGAITQVGFQEGDRIVSINDQKVMSEAEFMAFLRDDGIRNEKVKIIVFRGGRETVLYVTPAVIFREAVVYDPLWRYGIVIDDRYPDRIVILRVYPRTPAYYAGLRAGDVVLGVRGQRITRAADFVSALTSADGRLALQVNRANRTRDLQLDMTAETQARTALRPEVDAETRIDGRGRVERSENRPDLPADSPRIEKPRPNEPANRPRLGSPERTESPDSVKPVTPGAADRPGEPTVVPREPRVTTPPADAPALPPAPGTQTNPPTPRP